MSLDTIHTFNRLEDITIEEMLQTVHNDNGGDDNRTSININSIISYFANLRTILSISSSVFVFFKIPNLQPISVLPGYITTLSHSSSKASTNRLMTILLRNSSFSTLLSSEIPDAAILEGANQILEDTMLVFPPPQSYSIETLGAEIDLQMCVKDSLTMRTPEHLGILESSVQSFVYRKILSPMSEILGRVYGISLTVKENESFHVALPMCDNIMSSDTIRPDITIFKQNIPVLLIEVKRYNIRKNLKEIIAGVDGKWEGDIFKESKGNKILNQVLSYSYASVCERILITDGINHLFVKVTGVKEEGTDDWDHFSPNARLAFNYKLFCDDGSHTDITLKMLLANELRQSILDRSFETRVQYSEFTRLVLEHPDHRKRWNRFYEQRLNTLIKSQEIFRLSSSRGLALVSSNVKSGDGIQRRAIGHFTKLNQNTLFFNISPEAAQRLYKCTPRRDSEILVEYFDILGVLKRPLVLETGNEEKLPAIQKREFQASMKIVEKIEGHNINKPHAAINLSVIESGISLLKANGFILAFGHYILSEYSTVKPNTREDFTKGRIQLKRLHKIGIYFGDLTINNMFLLGNKFHFTGPFKEIKGRRNSHMFTAGDIKARDLKAFDRIANNVLSGM